MVNEHYLTEQLQTYKRNFAHKRWHRQKGQWEAIQAFQAFWDLDSAEFSKMLRNSLGQALDLWGLAEDSVERSILRLPASLSEDLKNIFRLLYDERRDLIERLDAFMSQMSSILEISHTTFAPAQYERAFFTYLWLRYPDKYYRYDTKTVKRVSQILGYSSSPTTRKYADQFQDFLQLYDDVNTCLKSDQELVHVFRVQLTPDCYADPELKTLTTDVCAWLVGNASRQDYAFGEPGVWEGTDYDPGLSVSAWSDLLQDADVFTPSALELMKRLKDSGGIASCKHLADQYGETPSFYVGVSVALAKRVCKAASVAPAKRESGTTRWWAVLYTGRNAEKGEDGSFVWKLRDELAEALDETDLDQVPLYANSSKTATEPGYWWLNANPKQWSFHDIQPGETVSYSLFNENGSKRRIFRNFLDACPGDKIIGYESTPVKQIVALGKVHTAAESDVILFEKTADLIAPVDYESLRVCPELAEMEFFKNSQGTLFRLSQNEYDFILQLIQRQNSPGLNSNSEYYGKEEFLDDVYMPESLYMDLVHVLGRKKNLILQGAPGVGKTYAAERLAWSIMGGRYEDQMEMVQFHQNYAYEDFVMGYRPTPTGFELKLGTFYRFCERAARYPDRQYFFLIDEINRGNVSRIFGEVLMLIEHHYRGRRITLAYDEQNFTVPENVHIIGMMNTADRSLALIDYALRRRFSFFDMEPGFDTPGFCRYQSQLDNPLFNKLVEQLKALNREIAQDPALGRGFCIGHSYLCGQRECSEEWLRSVVHYDILPLLREYCFDEPDKLHRWESMLQSTLP